MSKVDLREKFNRSICFLLGLRNLVVRRALARYNLAEPLLLTFALLCAACREAPESKTNRQGAAWERGPVPPTASAEVCEQKAQKYRELFAAAGATKCQTTRDCKASSALQFGKYNTTNCLTPLNVARITPALQAASDDYDDACERGCRMCRRTWPKVICANGECAWDVGSGGSPASP